MQLGAELVEIGKLQDPAVECTAKERTIRERRSIVSQQIVVSKVATLTVIESTCLGNSKGKSVRSVEQIQRRKFCWRSVFRIIFIFFSFGFGVQKKTILHQKYFFFIK